MSVVLQSQASQYEIMPGRQRYLAYGDSLMMVVLDLTDGPTSHPDPLHVHPHEQITYVSEGRVLFFLGHGVHELGTGDMIVVPPNQPHGIQSLTTHVRLIDVFNPIREEFLTQ